MREPIPPVDTRIDVLDRLRGFALLGIFLMNIEYFGRPLQDYVLGVPAGLQGLDAAAAWFVYTFVQGKFWVLFSLLFGMGFAVMADRARDAGRPFLGTYLRRTALLALFGLLHIALLWDGDILLSYAVTALVLMAFLHVRGHALWLSGAALYLGASALAALSGLVLQLLPPSQLAPIAAQMDEATAQAQAAVEVYAHGSFVAVAQQRLETVFAYMVPSAWPMQIPSILGVFLIGAWLVRSGRMVDVVANRGFFTRLLIVALPLAVLGVGASLAVGTQFPAGEDFPRAMLATGLMMLGNLPASLAIVSLFALLAGSSFGARMTAVLAPAGRMALTNYLTQSLICSLVFYGYGLGQYGEWGRASQVGFVVLVFVAQVLASRWWMARFEFGPLEGLWRAGTHLRAPRWRAAGH
ncbi:DUF418 domain-containing protein [Silanimonas sp.]|jgi:uncharacterized protein|uniref:DUF418 domain-containing protein n=1 Tax=Silanimonas sp. TaxID=1929290 RepID=UPI0022C6FB06|nr:DUF418 domain-containing protein [Silanimonas sp.]MCZ8164780.1 DUF418 domain-containing protein [Silanimonas sp.]